ncbi:M23 family metallopeptidase [Sphingomonas sp.]|uniref:M23 family metallopeptidase n=1 Tax=Sphingomonas sp. TaxID=28214 RepID=UPI003B00F154
MIPSRSLLVALGAASLLGAHRAPPGFRLGFPLQCRLGQSCFVQNYIDADPGPAVRDWHCGGRSYDGHNGVDIRLPSMAEQRAGVAVLAAARGRVLRVRDGVPDINVDRRGRAAVEGQQCGNGIVIDHGGGWETQYCHLAEGSIAVRPGQRVRAGRAIARVGLSGDTEFPHLHITVRKDGRVVDPFAVGAAPGSCGGGTALWRDRLPYQSGEVLLTGFATRVVEEQEAQEGGADQLPRPSRDGPALVAFAQAIGLERGDVQRIVVTGPDARIVVDGGQPPLDHDKAVTILSVGRKTPAGGWPAGVYQARYSVVRGDVEVIVKTYRVRL